MGQTCFKCDCNELNHGSSELDFSVFDTDIVQIAAYNNEGYCRIKDVFGSDREIIEAVTRCAEVAVEVRENDKAAFKDDNDGYEYISVKDVPRFQKSDTEIENNTSSSPNKNPPIDKSSGLNIQPSPKRQSGDKTDIKASRRPSVGSTNNTQPDKRSAGLKVKARPASDSGCGRGLSQADKPVIKAVSRSDNCLPRNVKGLTPNERNFKDEKVVPVSTPRLRSSGIITPPLPPRRFHAKKRIYQSDRASKTVSTSSQNSSQNVNVLNTKERPRSGQSFSASVKTRSEQSNPTIVKDASQSKKDSTNTVYWEIGDVPKKDDPMCRNCSSLRKSMRPK